jgi:hypothetical protein
MELIHKPEVEMKMESKLAYKKITLIERELRNLKKMIVPQKKIVHLKGMMKGLKITDEEFENAKKSLFRV